MYIQKVGDSVVLFPKEKRWETFLHGLNGFTEDFMAEGRDQGEMQERDGLLAGTVNALRGVTCTAQHELS